jgi:Zn-dependent peptidase ImmA (M78 family)/transcriptional regulator with XRE-family HTH domain
MTLIGDVLEVTRRARGMTQDDLCEKVALTQAALSRYENDLREPDDEIVERLSEALRVTPKFLTSGARANGALALDAHMRRQATVKVSTWKTLEAQLNVYRLHLAILFEDVSMRSEQAVPVCDPIDHTPTAAAQFVRAQWRMPLGPVKAMIRWVEAAGCLVIEEDFGTRRVYGLSQWVGEHPVMLINSAQPPDKKRLTIAHELGHLVLHSAGPGVDMEAEANQFAAEFLMPEHVIRHQLRNVTLGRLRDLKAEWMVSMQALYERSYNLGYVTKTERSAFYRALNARGWKMNEPYAESIPVEHPQLIQHVAETLRERGLSDAEITHLAGFKDRTDNFLVPPPAQQLWVV